MSHWSNNWRRKLPDNKKGWVMHVPVLSTSHVKEGTLDAVHDKGWPGPAFKVVDYEEGSFVWVGTNALTEPMPDELKPVVKWFRKNYRHESWIRFDRDGDVIEGLPVYEW